MNMNTSSSIPNNYSSRFLTAQPTRRPAQMQSWQNQPMAGGTSDNVQYTYTAPTSMTPTTLENEYYMAGLLTQFIGHRIRAQFLVGTTGPLVDLTGTLLQVGANYIIIQPTETDDMTVCDLYSITFLTVYR